MSRQVKQDTPSEEVDEEEELLIEELPATLAAPPTELPPPPVETRAATLPLRQLSWENFERLLVAIVRDVLHWRDVRRYGVKGQKQHGIDLFGYMSDQEVRTCQAKDVEEFGKGDLRKAINKFIKGKQPFKSRWLAVVVACPVERTEVLEELHNLKLTHKDFTLDLWDQEHVSELLRTQNVLVRRFFGPEWERVFCDPLPVSAQSLQSQDKRQRRLKELQQESRARLVNRWSSAGLEETLAEAFAAEVNLGLPKLLSASLPEKGLILLEGDFGSGKSTAGERLHQRDLERALADVITPVPVYLTARHVRSSLKEAVVAAAVGLENPAQVGARVVLDGIDEPGLNTARDFLEQAHVLVRHWPHTRCILTARPFATLRPSEQISMPLLDDEEVKALVERIAGVQAWAGWPSSVWESARRPLFAIVAASLRHTLGRPIPRSTAGFLEALVQQAMERTEQLGADAHAGLQRLAALTLASGGTIPTGEFGAEPDIQQLLTTRLVVRRGRTLSFALPVVEQYFGGQALLTGAVKADTALASLESFERWRYAMLLAVGAGSWERVSALLVQFAGRYPGAATWVVQKSLSEYSPLEDSEDALNLPTGAECAERLRSALATWVDAVRPLSERTRLLGTNGSPLTLAAHSEGTQLVTTAWSKEEAPALVLEGELPREWKRDLSQDALWSHSQRVVSTESAWPWKVSLTWLRDEFERILSAKDLPLRDTSPGRAERRWALARAITGQDGNVLHAPIAADVLLTNLQQLLESLAGSADTDSVQFGGSLGERSNFWVKDLRELASDLEAGKGIGSDGLLRRPWTVPDRPELHSGWVWNFYSPEAQLRFVQETYSAALDIYEELITTWMPKLRPTLDWACAFPIRLEGILEFGQGNDARGEPWLHYDVRPLPPGNKTEVIVTPATPDFDLYRYTHERAEDAERILAMLQKRSPTAASWFRVGDTSTAVSLNGDMPAIDLAYKWLSDHLQALSLVSFGYHPPR